MEAVLPVELQIPSLRVMMEAGLPESVWAQARYQELQMIDEKRLKALYHVLGYQRRVERAFNKKVRVRDLKKGDLVLKSFRAPVYDPRGKFKPKWSGPYIVDEVLPGKAQPPSPLIPASLPESHHQNLRWNLLPPTLL
ncbi:uncharacterized protein LOC143866918 [Tasmannia lanceolata]|uniref:uncharacterized protein LOC143866918 n=1 Tax=Tasmannia lanceolata TaxID=3420 RepID=UPI0040640834